MLISSRHLARTLTPALPMSMYFSPRFKFWTVTLLAIVLQLLTTLSLVSRSHDPISQQEALMLRHGPLDQGSAAIDHVHHDSSAVEETAQHVHGHDPADHRHDTPAPIISVALTTPPALPGTWVDNVSSALRSNGIGVLERPPKHLS